MDLTLPLTTRRAWAVTVAVLAVFLPLVVADEMAADAEEPIPVPPVVATQQDEPVQDELVQDEPVHEEGDAPESSPPTEAPTTTVPPTTAPPTTAPPTTAATSSVWTLIAECETGGNWSLQVRSFGGGLMIHQDTWEAMGGTRYASRPSLASRSAQIHIAEKIVATTGDYSAWPACRRKLGLY